MSENEAEWHMIAHGKVHGVGFRATTYRLAKELDLSGTVENLEDGTVEIYVQGSGEKLLLFSERLHAKFHGYIQKITTDPRIIKQKINKFSIL